MCLCVVRACRHHLSRVHPYRVGVQSEPGCSSPSYLTYHDGIFTKRNKFNLLLHETFGGGFSPPAVAKINRLARKAQRSGVDRTAYPPHSRLSFVSHHAERISIASVKGVNRAILDRRAKLSSELSRRA